MARGLASQIDASIYTAGPADDCKQAELSCKEQAKVNIRGYFKLNTLAKVAKVGHSVVLQICIYVVCFKYLLQNWVKQARQARKNALSKFGMKLETHVLSPTPNPW